MPEPARRPLWTVLGLLLAAALALWTAALLPHPGNEVPALNPLAVLALALMAAVLATSGWPRRLFGALALVASLIPFGVLVRSDLPPAPAVLCGLAGVLLAAAGVLVMARGHRMPRMGSRYQRHQSRGPSNPTMWDELDAGRDPTG